MASKKSNRPNKSAFIRQHPDAPAADVVEKGKAAGLVFSPAFRSKAQVQVRTEAEDRRSAVGL